MKLLASVRSFSSRWVAVSFAATYLVVSAAVGVVLLTMPRSELEVGDDPASYLAEDTAPRSDGLGGATTGAAPAGFQWVRGPEDMATVIPHGWRTVEAGAPGALRAVDPADATRVVGFGGAPATSTDLVGVHLAYEQRFAGRTSAYERLDLNSATYGGHPAVEWEFRHDDGSGPQRVRALYWLVGDIEYFVFVAGPDEQWARMRPVYDAMVANSRP